MDYLPLAFNVRESSVLLVGAGPVAARKATLLKRASATLYVVAPEICPELQALLTPQDRYFKRKVEASDIEGKQLIVAATSDHEVHIWLAAIAKDRNLPINVVDEPDLCSFIFPAIVDRNPIIIGISSSGTSPVLARLLRKRLEAWLPTNYGVLARFVGSLRERVKAVLATESERRLYYETLVESEAAEAVLNGNDEVAERFASDLLVESNYQRGDVALVGAGPGDPDLMTFKALRLLQRADVVLYDRLVSQEILDLARRDAQRIYVGKQRDQHAVAQADINHTLLDLAQQGLKVVRLKGGDPFIFGRGGEELELLAEHGVPFQVVPGITSAAGAASYAGIPLTHRDYAQSVRFVPGYLKQGTAVLSLDDCGSADETLVVYMGLKALDSVVSRLLDAGRDPTTPIALIQNATLPTQVILIGTLVDIASKASQQSWDGPTLILVGQVIRLHQKLSWFNRPDLEVIT
ncbi:MAG: siroheme synthase CysG [Halieaceae bacterium]|nr:siroheme synthase CysG [Halieaceae bacterium]